MTFFRVDKKRKIYYSTFGNLTGLGFSDLNDWNEFLTDAKLETKDFTIDLILDAQNGRYGSDPDPFNPLEPGVTIYNRDDKDQLSFIQNIPWAALFAKKVYHYAYRIFFMKHLEGQLQHFTDPRHHLFQRGYIGVTSRQPLLRFIEHGDLANKNQGSFFHQTWYNLFGMNVHIIPIFMIVGGSSTRQGIFNIEENLVDTYLNGTLMPNGLNAIRGGMAGIRELWKLGIIADRKIPTPEERDEAEQRVPSKPHLVRGFWRQNMNWDTGEVYKTWVNPHWRSLPKVT